jgi:photosystem II stability/assembly factor-like uncharacterized protein
MRFLISTLLWMLCYLASAQNHLAKPRQHDISLPLWAEMMYSENPVFQEVIREYQLYFNTHDFEKTVHTQYFKRWVGAVKGKVASDGTIVQPDPQWHRQAMLRRENHNEFSAGRGGEIWHFEGPEHHVVSDGSLTPGFRHSNVYCHDRSSLNPDILFCGTESGGLYKTDNAGQSWTFVTKELLVGWVSAVRIKPTDDQFVIMCGANELWRTTDGGNNWEIIGQPSFASQNISAWEIAYHPVNNDVIFAATNLGFFRSEDSGDNWTEILPERCETIAFKPDDPDVVCTIQYEPSLDYSRFYKSTDGGLTFEMSDTGWFDSGMGDIKIEGGRLATTEADPNKIYALLVGYQNDGSEVITNGWVGTWVSDDAGATWTLPHGQIGTPYSEEHPNLMNFSADDGEYSQIHYNTTMVASQIDPDKILIGGLNLWISADGASTYQALGGYVGNMDYFHVDQQEYRIYKTGPDSEEIWFSNDGGIGFSPDFMETYTNLNRGILAVNLWGYDQGWNEDIMVGGRYHNGNMAYFENYPEGEFLALGGGEAATGYVKYSDENKTLFSDIGGYVIPDVLDELPEYFSVGLNPNESYWNNGSSRIMFDHTYYNIAWCGRENKLYRSENGGGSFSLVNTFGNNTEHGLYWMEQSYANPDFIYVQQGTGNSAKLWRSTDHGDTWSEIDMPLNLRYLCFSLSGDNPDELWLSYYDGQNGSKVYHTANGGADWNNLTTAQLNDESVWAIAHQYGTDGGVYIALQNGLVYYRNNSMNEWAAYGSGLPASSEPLRIVPFYRDQVIRLATWNLGVWEAPLYESSVLMADFSAEYSSYFCPGDPIHFVNHSVCSPDATFSWSFPGANPATSTEPYPTVVYNEIGTYDVILVVTDGNDSQTVVKTSYISSLEGINTTVAEDFEDGGIPSGWILNGNGSWTVAETSAYNTGDYCMKFDNYYYDAQGARDEIWLGKTQYSSPVLEFDVAYAQYNDETYTDTLAVLYSVDCGATWTEIFVAGGDDLATAPDNTGYFVPDAAQWEERTIVTGPLPFGDIIFSFQNRGHYGNVIYVDNINISPVVRVDELEEVLQWSVYPNPAHDVVNVSVRSLQSGDGSIRIFDGTGKLLDAMAVYHSGGRLEKQFDFSHYTSGIYWMQLTDSSGRSESKKIEIRH